MWNQMQMNLSMKEMDLLIQRTDLWLPKGCVCGGAGCWIGYLRLRNARFYTELLKRVLPYSAGKHIQYHVINHYGKEKKKKNRKLQFVLKQECCVHKSQYLKITHSASAKLSSCIYIPSLFHLLFPPFASLSSLHPVQSVPSRCPLVVHSCLLQAAKPKHLSQNFLGSLISSASHIKSAQGSCILIEASVKQNIIP